MNLPVKVNEREKKVLVIGGIILLLIMAFYIFSWYSDTKKSVKDFSDARLFMLRKQIEKIVRDGYAGTTEAGEDPAGRKHPSGSGCRAAEISKGHRSLSADRN
jgi:hypothetical protein